ncbi:uncharacterized protein TNCV_906381 [Trichonephila clavipes]|nr:uncharacterized protein TNCV_906381 [Trichonephila clavipes]
MTLPTPLKRFNKKELGLDTAVETVATVSMQIAAKEAKDVREHSDIPVAIDGTWQKHGLTSLNGAGIATSVYTRKVLDASILSRFCKCLNKMYNENCIEKLECVGYVEKRIGTRLRALKLKMKGKKLSDKKTLDGHGRLTDAEIEKLQRFYGLAIRNNTDSINSMKRAI